MTPMRHLLLPLGSPSCSLAKPPRFSILCAAFLLFAPACGSPSDAPPDDADVGTTDASGLADGGDVDGARPDADGDGVPDHQDNCPAEANPGQWDSDADGQGDACEEQLGTVLQPLLIPGDPALPDYYDARDTTEGPSDLFDVYPGHENLDESGPEWVYLLRVEQAVELRAWIAFPEPQGVDVDVHLIQGLDPQAPDPAAVTVIARDHYEVVAVLEPGAYYLVLDTYVSGGEPLPGPYALTVSLQAWHAGTVADPIPVGGDPPGALVLPWVFTDARDTHLATSDALDVYPGYEQLDESGPEYVYRFTLDEPARLAATIDFSEPAGADIDLHLLSDTGPVALVTRGDTALYALLEPGTYHLVADTYVDGGVEQLGPYFLWLSIRPRAFPAGTYFNDWILSAVDYLWANYRLLGYDSAVLTHDIPYGDTGLIEASGGARTMCVAAVMEVILTAMNLYAEDTGDDTVFDFLPEQSWETLHDNHIKAHIWVNHSLGSGGTADALENFGMGEFLLFEDLTPGSFVNLNRTTGTGHAVVFLGYLDLAGNIYETWNPDVVGFYYFSSQGGYDVGAGGLDFRYAVFSDYGAPPMPGKRDLNVIYSTDSDYLNTGKMYHPDGWVPVAPPPPLPGATPSRFDPLYFDGRTADD